MAQHTNTARPHASKQIAPYPTCECRPTARIASIRIPRECDADLTSFPPALSLKAQTQAARSILHRPPGRAAKVSEIHRGGPMDGQEAGFGHQPSEASRRVTSGAYVSDRETHSDTGVTGVERHAPNFSQAAERSPVPHTMRSAVRLLCSKAFRARKLFPIRSAAEVFRHAD